MNTVLAPPLTGVSPTEIRDRRRSWIYFGGCDYFRLSWHPKLRAAVERGLRRWGLTTSASRRTTGNHPLYEALEERLADYFQAPAAVLVSSGYAAASVLAQGWEGCFARAWLDDRAHASLHDAARFLGCPSSRFAHRDANDLARLLDRGERCAVWTDGMFAWDGSTAPLRKYANALKGGSRLVVDDAHAAGVIGRHGRGTLEHEGLPRTRVAQLVTLSKAFGLYGGAILCDESTRRRVLGRSRWFLGNTPLPLPLAAAAPVALDLLGPDSPLRTRLWRNVRRVKEPLGEWETSNVTRPGPIVLVVPRHAAEREALSKRLRRAGIHPPFIEYPGGPTGGYFRFAISSAHRKDELDRLTETLLAHAR